LRWAGLVLFVRARLDEFRARANIGFLPLAVDWLIAFDLLLLKKIRINKKDLKTCIYRIKLM